MSVIQVNNVHKKFKVFYDKGQTFKERLLFRNRNYYEDRWVLQGVDLSIDKGEVVGLIGRNGCGKSTLLKLMTKIMYPDKGDIKMEGRVSSLIELGAGFHPDMRGKENIYTNASIFGLGKKEIDQRLNEIISFSELGAFINNPVRTYSSGMYMRLAFSVAINVDADILLIDEILAVGDANFQAKCFERMNALKQAGTTIVIVTHDMNTIERFCTKGIWLNDGKIMSCGDPAQVVADYTRFMTHERADDTPAPRLAVHETAAQTPGPAIAEPALLGEVRCGETLSGDDITALSDGDAAVQATSDPMPILEDAPAVTDEQRASISYGENRFGLRYIEIIGAEICDADGRPVTVLRSFEPVTVYISYLRHKNLAGYVFGFSIHTPEGVMIMGANTQLDNVDIPQLKPHGWVALRINRLPLLPGTYVLQVAVVDRDGVPMDYYREYSRFEVTGGDGSVGLVSIERAWDVC